MSKGQALVAVTVCILAAGALWLASWTPAIAATARPTATVWEYAELRLGGEKPVFVQESRESNILVPMGRLSGEQTGGQQSETDYTIIGKIVRNTDLGALNMLGEDGWEVVTVTVSASQRVILLKRQVR